MLFFLFSSPVGPLSQFNSWFFRKNKSRFPRAGVWHIRFAFKVFVLNILFWGSFVTVYTCEFVIMLLEHEAASSQLLSVATQQIGNTRLLQRLWLLNILEAKRLTSAAFSSFFPFLSTLQNTLAFVFNLTLKMSRVCKTALLTRNIGHWCTTVNSSRWGGKTESFSFLKPKVVFKTIVVTFHCQVAFTGRRCTQEGANRTSLVPKLQQPTLSVTCS